MRIATFLILVVGFLPGAAQAQVELTLSAPPAGFVLGEPVVLRATMRNTSPEPAASPRFLKPEFGIVQYYVGSEPDASSLFVPYLLKEPAEPTVQLEPGGEILEDVEIFYGADGWFFRSPGQYQVRAVVPGGSLQSNTVNFSILPPQSPEEETAAEAIINSDQAGRFLLFRGGEHLDEGREVLERVMELAPNSPLSDHAGVSLGLNWLRPAADWSAGEVRAANPSRALDLLSVVDIDTVGIERGGAALLGQAEAHRLLQDNAAADRLKDQAPDILKRVFPELDMNTWQNRIAPQINRDLKIE
ncbi:hypothetical protein GOC07_30545 [Sinorhizobium meliloti]|nr:hypothetical protein [Sinorhizobium meliloti]